MCFYFCFCFLVCIPADITRSEVEMKVCAITAVIKKYNSIIKKKKQSDKKVLLVKINLNSIEELISKALIDSNIIQYELISVNCCWNNM